MKEQDLKTDEHLLKLIKSDDQFAFKLLFNRHYKSAVSTIYRYVNDFHAAEDIAQGVFVKLWNKRSTLDIQVSFASYLRRMCVNDTLNYMSANKRLQFWESGDWDTEIKDTTQEDDDLRVLNEHREGKLWNAINDLPEKCRVVFCLNRFDGLTHKEISEKLDISTKTIENHMTKALKMLKESILHSPSLIFFPFFQLFFH